MITLLKIPVLLALAWSMAGCTYLGTAWRQADYSSLQGRSPTQRVYKHLLETENYFVFGRIGREKGRLNADAVAVIALSDRFRPDEVVDVSHFPREDSYYGLNLPAGEYRLLVVSDLNRDGFYDGAEVLGERRLTLGREQLGGKVLGGFDIDVGDSGAAGGGSFRVAVRRVETPAESFFYPRGTIRSLDDPIFSPAMATLGMYEPAAFLEEAPQLFYALEEDAGYKVPVVFVHGIDGSARDFAGIVAQLDRSRYRPWFFYYPSGDDLDRLSEMFYRIFLSGKVIPLADMPMVIVAHSMGGLVARDALNRLSGAPEETHVRRLITIATPMAGHPAAQMGVNGPVALPSWRDLSPDSDFLHRLRRARLPAGLEYHLIYAYGNQGAVKLGENSDGVVPLSSQLAPEAQGEATSQFGVNDTHAGILQNPGAIRRIVEIVAEVKAPVPEEHLRELVKGGYPVALGEEFSPMERHFIRTLGHWMHALETGSVAPFHPAQEHFLRVCRGEVAPDSEIETAWLKFRRLYPGDAAPR